MAEINIDGGPIFVDVSSNQQFPILFSHLHENGELLNKIKSEIQVPENPNETSVAESSSTLPSTAYNTTEADLSGVKIRHKRIRCLECNRYTTETEEQMVRHVRKAHRGENPFQCYMCEYSTYNKQVFEEHIRVHQGIKPFKCSVCDYRSASKKNTKKHELIHRDDNPRKCPHCIFVARHTKSLISHLKAEHEDHTADPNKIAKVCVDCGMTFETSKLFRNHLRMKNNCTMCSKQFCSKKRLTKHLQVVHKTKETPKRAPKKTIESLFKCAHCKWSSNSKPKILLHLIHHPKQTVNEDDIDISILRNFGIME